MDLSFSPAEEASRAELRAWLAANAPSPDEPKSLADEVAFLRAWQRTPHDGGWVGIICWFWTRTVAGPARPPPDIDGAEGA